MKRELGTLSLRLSLATFDKATTTSSAEMFSSDDIINNTIDSSRDIAYQLT